MLLFQTTTGEVKTNKTKAKSKFLSREEFISLIGKDVVVDYINPLFPEIQQWDMRNFYITENNEIKHKRIDSLIVDTFIRFVANPHKGTATHG